LKIRSIKMKDNVKIMNMNKINMIRMIRMIKMIKVVLDNLIVNLRRSKEALIK